APDGSRAHSACEEDVDVSPNVKMDPGFRRDDERYGCELYASTDPHPPFGHPLPKGEGNQERDAIPPRLRRDPLPAGERQLSAPWQCLYFLPDPHGHGSLRPTLGPSRTTGAAAAMAAPACWPSPSAPGCGIGS